MHLTQTVSHLFAIEIHLKGIVRAFFILFDKIIPIWHLNQLNANHEMYTEIKALLGSELPARPQDGRLVGKKASSISHLEGLHLGNEKVFGG
jgi:hypothetical protein